MLRILSAVALVHCALGIWSNKPVKEQLVPDDINKCLLTAGNITLANNWTLYDSEGRGKKLWWEGNTQYVRFPTKLSRQFKYSIKYVEVTDLDCTPGADPGIFAAICKRGVGYHSVMIQFHLRKRKYFNFKVVILG